MMSIDPTQKRERPTLLHPLLPRFTVSKLERRYRDDRLGYRLTALRVSGHCDLDVICCFGFAHHT